MSEPVNMETNEINNVELTEQVDTTNNQGYFGSETTTYVITFIIVFILAYFILGKFMKNTLSGGSLFISRLIDFSLLGVLAIYILSYLSSNNYELKTEDIEEMYQNTVDYLDNNTSIITTTLIVLAFYMVTYIFGVPMSSDMKPISIRIIEIVLITVMTVVLFVFFFKNVLNISIVDVIQDLKDNLSGTKTEEEEKDAEITLDDTKQTDISNAAVDGTQETTDVSGVVIPDGNEVFNVSNNAYTYDEAKAVCSIYGAELATYDQIEQAYNNGAEWCNYGWSEGQMAYFPTQKSTWTELQKNPKAKNNCGRPGINGGFMANPNLKFGVNCFGKKPDPTDDDVRRLESKKYQTYPDQIYDKEMKAKMEKWKKNADKMLQLNSYNKNMWSRY
jgi:hypothetical protein